MFGSIKTETYKLSSKLWSELSFWDFNIAPLSKLLWKVWKCSSVIAVDVACQIDPLSQNPIFHVQYLSSAQQLPVPSSQLWTKINELSYKYMTERAF